MLHPFVTHFPIVLILLLGVLELYSLWDQSLQKAKELLLVCFLISVLAAFFSGFLAQETASQSFQVSVDIIAYHQIWAKASLFLSFPLVILGFFQHRASHAVGMFAWSYRVLLIAVILLLGFTSYLGGELVFSYGAGVRAPLAGHEFDER